LAISETDLTLGQVRQLSDRQSLCATKSLPVAELITYNS
jgi:hypothetical protein